MSRPSDSTVSARVAEVLAGSLDVVFGVMGNGNAYVLDALEPAGVRFVAVRHEAGGVAAADAYFRASGRLAAATATYGPGLTNAVTALAESVQARIPLVLVVGDAPTSGARPWDIDQQALAASVGAATFTVGVADAGAVTASAVQHALAERTAVVLAVPYDLAAQLAEPESIPGSAPVPPVVPEKADLDEVAAILAAAERPLLLAGRGAHLAGAGPALRELAARLHAVTASSSLGRGQFDHRYDLGVVGGFGQAAAMDLLREADAVLVVGAGLNQFTTAFGELFGAGSRILRVDLPDARPHPAVQRTIVGDARLAAEGLLERVAPRKSGWRERVTGLEPGGALRVRDAGEGILADGRLDPRSLAEALAGLLPEDRVVVSDGGHFIGWANTYWPVAAPGRMIMVGTAFQTIGLGLPSAVGAAVAAPVSTVVLTTGDGGALMGLADLESVARVVRSGVVVVWNDAAYGAEVHLYGLRGLDQGPMLIPEVDFAALARAVGANASIVRTLDDLRPFADWVAAGAEGLYLLDARISREVIAPYQLEIVAVNSRK
ncbi:MAG: thiamine pyrophosphate-binding protein [Naasia sp.]|nr:thiamine pyrophosphate-binding protein [Naasia sp.]